MSFGHSHSALMQSILDNDLKTFVYVVQSADSDELNRPEGGIKEIIPDRAVWTPLSAIAALGRDEMLEMILKLNLDVKVDAEDKYGATPLFYASDQKHFRCAQLLLNARANLNKQTRDGETSLMQIAGSTAVGAEKTGLLFLKYGASVDLKDKNNATAISRAAAVGNHRLLEAMLLTPFLKAMKVKSAGSFQGHLCH
jgi:ankyrin repeat protein